MQVFWWDSTDWAATAAAAAAAMVLRYLAPVFSALSLLVPMLALPVALTTGGGVVLMRSPCLRIVPSSRVVDAPMPIREVAAAVPACEVVIVVTNASSLAVPDAIPLVAVAAPVRPDMVGIAVAMLGCWCWM